MTSHTKLDLEFALVPALHLAEGGRTMRERRRGECGPLYWCCFMPSDTRCAHVGIDDDGS